MPLKWNAVLFVGSVMSFKKTGSMEFLSIVFFIMQAETACEKSIVN